MMMRLRFSNFYSFVESTDVSFQIGKKPAESAYDITASTGQRLNKIIAVVGPNGSGKTQLIKPFAFLSWFVAHSFLQTEPEAAIPVEPHALRRGEPSSFELYFYLQGSEYRYQLVLNQNVVIHESLHQKTSKFFSYLFVREKTEVAGEPHYSFKQKGFSFPASRARDIRANTSLLGAAHSYDVPEAKPFVEFFRKFSFNINFQGRQHFHGARMLASGKFFFQNQELMPQMERIMCGFDLGISNIHIRELDISDSSGEVKKSYVPFAIHQSGTDAFELPLWGESSGTQSAFVLLSELLPVLTNGGIAIIDEIDNDLHPHMLPHIMDMFKFEHTNPHNAQLIFTCHTPEVLNLLRKHQVYLVEKQNQLSEAWRLDEVEGVRADDNLYAKYMAGALGAVPEL